MAGKTLISELGHRILRNPSDANTETVYGKLASTYKPGQIVYESALGTWTTQTASAGH
jgi:hypothetical protein